MVALLIGLALSRGPDKPRIAFVNEVPAGEEFSIGGPDASTLGFTRAQLRERVDPVEVASRAEAERMVRDGDVAGAR